MRFRTAAAVAATATMVLATTAPAIAQEDDPPPGIGSTVSELTVLGVDAGNLLSLDLLTDIARTNTDPAAGAASALAELQAFVVESPALGVSESLPVARAESGGAAVEDSKDVQVIDNPVVGGSLLPLTAAASVTDAGALANLTAGLTDLDLLGGIANLGTSNVAGASSAAGDVTEVTRTISLDSLGVLDLEPLLAGLGIPLESLSLDTMLGLIGQLGLTPQLDAALSQAGLPGLGGGFSTDALLASIEDLTAATALVTTVIDQVDGATFEACETVIGPLVDVLDGLGAFDGLGDVDDLVDLLDPAAEEIPLEELLEDLLDPEEEEEVVPVVGDPTGPCSDVSGLVDNLTASLEDLLDQLLAALLAPADLLSGVSLVTLDGIDVELVTKAADTVEGSVATVDGSMGALAIGALDLGLLDLTAGLETVNGVLAQADATLGTVLGSIAPQLGDLVQVQQMIETTSITEDASGAITAAAEFTGLQIDVANDAAALLAAIQALAAGTSLLDDLAALESLLAGAGLESMLGSAGLPPLPGGIGVPAQGQQRLLGELLPIDVFSGLLAGTPTSGLLTDDAVLALSEGLSVEVLSASQRSTFGRTVTPPTQTVSPSPALPALPTTGSNDQLMLLLGGLVLVGVLGARRFFGRTQQ